MKDANSPEAHAADERRQAAPEGAQASPDEDGGSIQVPPGSPQEGRILFEHCPIPLSEEDYSEVRKFIDGLRRSGVEDLGAYFSAHPEAVVECARMVRIVDVNKATLDLCGCRRKEELLGELCKVFQGRSHEPFARLLLDLAEGKACASRDVIAQVLFDGGMHVHIRWAIVPGCEETWSRVLVSIADVSEQKRVEEDLRRSEERYRLLIEGAGVPIFTVGKDGVFQMMNRAAAADLGGEPGDFIGKTLWDLFPRDIADERMERLRQAIESASEYSTETRMALPSGEKWYRAHVQPVRDADGGAMGTQIIAHDITDRVRAEEQVHRLSRFRETVIDNATVWLHVLDPQARVVVWNKAAEQISGYSRDEALGHSMWETLCPDEQYRTDADAKVAPRLKRGETVDNIEHTILCKDGQSKVVRYTMRPLRSQDGRSFGFLVMGQDITEQRQAEEDLLRYQEQLRSLASKLSTTEERERQRIAGDLHDQIGQALAIAVMKLGVLRDSAPDRGLDDVAQLIEGALQATRSLTTELSPPVLHELGFGAALEWLAEEAQERDGLRVEVEDDGQSGPLNGKIGITLFKAVRELLVNVARHSRAKNVKVSVRRHGGEVRIAVRDDGVGFDPSEHHLKAVVEGGFGLFNIREQLSHLGGRLAIVSQPGRATTVSLSVPLAAESSAPEGPAR